jgi:hypothetical protein
MNGEKRKRGRPIGSGKNDTRYLARVADLLAQEPALTPTGAMRRVMQACTGWDAASKTALIRRWQAKWKTEGNALLTEARERARPRPASNYPTVPFVYAANYFPSTVTMALQPHYERLMHEVRGVQNFLDTPHMRALRTQMEEFRRTEEALRIRDLLDSPCMQELRRMQEKWRQLNPFGFPR